jgi:hypothetical protein
LPDFYSKFQQSVEGYLKHFTFNIWFIAKFG